MEPRMIQALVLLSLLLVSSICQASIFHPVSDSHRSAAGQVFKPVDGSFKSLEDTYQALRTFEILGIGKDLDISSSACTLISETLKSTSASLKDVSFALKSNQILKCKVDGEDFKAVSSRLQAAITKANSLLDFYYSAGSLLLLKDQASHLNIQLENAEQVFRSVKALGQSDGRWRYNSNKPESSTRAAGIAFQTLAAIVPLASADIDQSLIDTLKNDIVKLFDSIEKYDDGAMFFDEKVVDADEYQGPLSTTSSVVRGLVAFADVASGRIAVPGDKILGLAKYFLGIGVPGNSNDFFDQMDALALLENNSVSAPLILSLPSNVISFTKNAQLKVKVSTVLGSVAPPLTVKIVQAARSDSKNAPIIENQELKYDVDTGYHVLDALPKDFDVGKYEFVFKIALNNPSQGDKYATGGRTWVKVYFTGEMKVENAEISVLDSDLSNVESKKLDLSVDSSISLLATHLQKLRLNFMLASPSGKAFKPHQALLETKLPPSLTLFLIYLLLGSREIKDLINYLHKMERTTPTSGHINENQVEGEGENVLAKHVAFFDRNQDGVVYPWETFKGFRAIGCGIILSTVAGFVINIGLSHKTRPGKFPSLLFPIEIKNIAKAKHGSDSGVYDTQGRFVPSKFEAIFSKHARTNGYALTANELDEMLKANREPKDYGGWFAGYIEWKIFFNLCKDKNGLLQRDTIRAVYDGSLFEKLESERQSAKKHKQGLHGEAK